MSYIFQNTREKVIIFKIVGASPLQSEVIQNRVRQNERFSGNILEKIINTNHFDITFLTIYKGKLCFCQLYKNVGIWSHTTTP